MHGVENVVNVHDLHVWTISSGLEALSAHVTIGPGGSHKTALVALQARLRESFNITHVTLQLESAEGEQEENARLYQIIPRSESETDATSTRSGGQSAAARDRKD